VSRARKARSEASRLSGETPARLASVLPADNKYSIVVNLRDLHGCIFSGCQVRTPMALLLGSQVQLASAKGTGSEPGHGLKVAPQFTSMLELSHRAPVTALHWLPGVRISKEGSRPPTVLLGLATSLPVSACLARCPEVSAARCIGATRLASLHCGKKRAPPLFPTSSAVASQRGLRPSASLWSLAQGLVPMVAWAPAPAGGGGRQTGASRLLLLCDDLRGRPRAVLGRAEQLPPPPTQEVRRRAPRCSTCGHAYAVLGNALAPAPLRVYSRAQTPSSACAWQGHGRVRVAANVCAGAARAPGGRSARRAPELCGQGPGSPVCRGGVLARGRARLGGLRAPEGAAGHMVEVQIGEWKRWNGRLDSMMHLVRLPCHPLCSRAACWQHALSA